MLSQQLKIATSLLTYYQRFVMTSASSHPFNLSLVNLSPIQQKILKILPALMHGYWGLRQQCAFFDVWIFNLKHLLTIVSNWMCAIDVMKVKNVHMKRVCEIEHGSFTPLVFTTSGGIGKAAKSPTCTCVLPPCFPSNVNNCTVSS